MPTSSASVFQYAKFFWLCINPFSKWLVPMHGIIGGLALYRDELLPEPYNSWHIFSFLPSWPLIYWVALGAIIIAIALVDGAFWDRYLLEEARSNSRRVLTAQGIPYSSAKKRGASRVIAPLLMIAAAMSAYFIVPQEGKNKVLELPNTSQGVAGNKSVAVTKATVTISCVPIMLPLRREAGESIFSVLLHPNAANEASFFTFAKDRSWPNPQYEGYGFKCEFINEGNPINELQLSLQAEFTFPSDIAGMQAFTMVIKTFRTIHFGLPWAHNDRPIELYLANCAAWTVKAVFPETGFALMRGGDVRQKIYFDRVTKKMEAFGTFTSKEYFEKCGVR